MFGERPVPFSELRALTGLELGERTVQNLCSAGSEFGERTVPFSKLHTLAGSEFGERTGPNPGLAGSEFKERPVPWKVLSSEKGQCRTCVFSQLQTC